MSDVIVVRAVCLDCGRELKGVYWHGDVSDARYFPILMPAEDVRAGGGVCDHCEGQIQFELRPGIGPTEIGGGA